MNFWDFTPDEREQWRKQEITRAYIEELRKQGLVAQKTCLSAARDEQGATSLWAGVADGIDQAACIAEDPRE